MEMQKSSQNTFVPVSRKGSPPSEGHLFTLASWPHDRRPGKGLSPPCILRGDGGRSAVCKPLLGPQAPGPDVCLRLPEIRVSPPPPPKDSGQCERYTKQNGDKYRETICGDSRGSGGGQAPLDTVPVSVSSSLLGAASCSEFPSSERPPPPRARPRTACGHRL